MISKKQLEIIKNIDNEYVISGSSAVMLYVGRDIRPCNDLDIAMQKPDVAKKLIEYGFNADVSSEKKEWQDCKGVRLVKLEDLISYKINRYSREYAPKDIFDLYYLFEIGYDRRYIKQKIQLAYIAESKIGKEKYEQFLPSAFEKISYTDCIDRLNTELKKIVSEQN